MNRPSESLPARVELVEVGPRDGLQNEAARVSVDDKVRFIEALAAAGHRTIEIGAFVGPARVPQMADTDLVCQRVAHLHHVRRLALVPNLKGLERARTAGLSDVAVFAAASETFSRKNINQSVEESLVTYAEVCREAAAAKIRVRGYLSTAFGCPYEGAVPPARVVELSVRLLELGCCEVAVSDTIGVAHPGQVNDVMRVLTERVDVSRVALHLHDTRGMAIANVLTALRWGVSTFDASAGGLGGCPYAPGATGNLATEDLVFLLDGLGIASGVSLRGMLAASAIVEPLVGHPLPSRVYRAESAAHKST